MVFDLKVPLILIMIYNILKYISAVKNFVLKSFAIGGNRIGY